MAGQLTKVYYMNMHAAWKNMPASCTSCNAQSMTRGFDPLHAELRALHDIDPGTKALHTVLHLADKQGLICQIARMVHSCDR